MTQPERHRQRNAYAPPQFAMGLCYSRFRLLEVGENAYAPIVKSPAGIAQSQPPGSAVEQLHAEPAFQCRDPAADRRSRDVQPRCRSAESGGLYYRDEGFQILEPIHDYCQFCNYIMLFILFISSIGNIRMASVVYYLNEILTENTYERE